MVTIHKNKGFFSHIENLDKSSFHKLKSILSYEDKKQVIARVMAKKKLGYIPKHLKAWNGMVYLLDEKGKYPTGLTEKIIEFFQDEKIDYQLIDNQISDFEKEQLPIKGNIELRPHQIDALEAIKKNKSGMIQASCGFGKTKLSIIACQEIGALPFLFIVHRLSLLNQTFEEYSNYFDVPIGYIGNGKIDVKKINIASIATICSALKIKYKSEDKEKTKYTEEQLEQVRNLLHNCKFICHDELHHSAANTSQTILKKINNADYKIGLSATIFRTSGDDIMLEASFGPVIYKKSASELIDEGFLVKPKIYFIKYSDAENEIKFPKNNKQAVYSRVYKECIVDNEEYNLMIANLAISSANKGRSTLISVKQVEHGKNIIEAFKKFNHGHEVHFLFGEDKEETFENHTKRFYNKEFLILGGTIFDEGWDCSNIDAVINAGAGASGIKSIQLTGRALRNHPGKTKAFVYDFIHPFSFLYQNSQQRIENLADEPNFQIEIIDL